MKSRNLELKVGFFVIIGIIILLFGYLWFRQINLRRTGYEITIDFNDATGLKSGDPILVLGVEKGKVLSIKLIKNSVFVLCYIEHDVILKKDVTAALKDVALISGTKFIKLKPGNDKELLDISKPFKGKGAPSFSLSELGDILDPIREIAEKISGEEIEKTLENINIASQELVGLIRENRAGIKRTVKNAEKDLKKIADAADRFSESLELLSQFLSDINEGEGTMGKLMKDEKLYDELEATLKETKELIKDIKKNPKKYINVRIF